MNGRTSRIALGLTLVLKIGACARTGPTLDEFEGVGQREGSSEPPVGIVRPVGLEDIEAVQQRGRLLAALERAMAMAYSEGLESVGRADRVPMLPLVDVDPGERSAQVLFIRWLPDQTGALPPLDAQHAQRWLLVSMLLSPDRVLDVKLIEGALPPQSQLSQRVDVLTTAAQRLQTLVPEGVFHLLDLYEQRRGEPGGLAGASPVTGHVYALSIHTAGPDLELVVDLPRRREPTAVRDVWVVHEPGAAAADPIRVPTVRPGPLTVARAMLQGAAVGTGSVGVQSPGGSWTVDTMTGQVRASGEVSRP